jgi:hypothetical protein
MMWFVADFAYRSEFERRLDIIERCSHVERKGKMCVL